MFPPAVKVGDSLILINYPNGFSVLKDTAIIPIPEFRDKIKIGQIYYNICESAPNEMLIISSYEGLFRFTGKTKILSKMQTSEEVDKFIKQNTGSKIEKIDENKFAIYSRKGSRIIIIDKNGNLINTINSEKGLPLGKIYNIFIDKDKNLWTVCINGIARTDINYPITKYSKNQGVNSTTYKTVLFNNTLYIGAANGCYSLKPHKLNIMNIDNHHLKPIPLRFRVRDFLVLKKNLLTFGNLDINHISDTTSKLIYETEKYANSVNYNKKFPDKIFIGHSKGLDILKIKKNEEILFKNEQMCIKNHVYQNQETPVCKFLFL
jgi:ligand-binding sensor domain-containing protein